MKDENRYFIMLLGIAAVIVTGVIYENTLAVLRPPTMAIDVEKVKIEIDRAGLLPREALYWEKIK